MDYSKARNRIINRIEISESGCWEYSLKVRPNGYARISFINESWYAHRLSYIAFNEIDEADIRQFDICHSCDNRKCVNPAHLFIGTRLDNMQDAVNKGRVANGFDLPQTKIGIKEKEEIMSRVFSGEKYTSIAIDYGVTPQLIGKIAINNGVRRR